MIICYNYFTNIVLLTLVVDNSAYRFRVDDHYLFVSRKNFTGNKEADVKSRRLYVTNNYASDTVKFNEVQLPSLRDEQVRKRY